MAVTLSLEGVRPQRRATVAFRVILLIPHLLFTVVLQVVAFVVIFFAWFAVLFTARMPTGMGDFLRRVLQYQTRVYAYGLLLTDRFPPFDVGPSDYAVELEIDEPGTFNRAAVLFRFILQLWALFLSQIATSGLFVIQFFVWLVTLVSGRIPATAYLANAAVLRYQMRTWAYVGMLTTEYPGGLFGDRDDPLGTTTSPVEDLTDLPSSPRITRLVLSRGAKAIIVLSLLLGLGLQALNAASTTWGFGSAAELRDMHDDFDDAYDEWDAATRDCSRGGSADCQVTANAPLRAAIERYERRLIPLEVPESSVDDGLDMVIALDAINELLGQMSETGDSQEQLRIYFLIEDARRDYDDEYEDFLSAISFG